MKVKKIIEICKREERLFLFEGGDIQWLSDGCAVYPLFDMPHFDIESLLATYDIPDSKRDKIRYKHQPLPGGLCFDDFADEESKVEMEKLRLVYNGIVAVPIYTSQGVCFIDQKYLAPLADMDSMRLEVYERQTESGQMYFAIKGGVILVAVIMPLDIVDRKMVTELCALTERCEVALFNKEAHTAEPVQTTMEGEEEQNDESTA